MKKTIIGLVIVVCAFIIAIAFYAWYSSMLNSRDVSGHAIADSIYKTRDVTIRGYTIHTLVADTQPLQNLGLGGRDGLEEGQGMLFVFDRDGIYRFWMKDMRFSIDIIWISGDKRIIYMAQDIAPSTYPEPFGPHNTARYVLEVPANDAVTHDFRIGDPVSF